MATSVTTTPPNSTGNKHINDTYSLTVTGDASPSTIHQPRMAVYDSSGNPVFGQGQKPASGSTSVVQVGGANLALTAVPAILANATTAFQLLAANTARISFEIYNNDPSVSYYIGVTSGLLTDETSRELKPGQWARGSYQGILYARTAVVPTRKLTITEES